MTYLYKPKNCLVCGCEFTPKSGATKYCSVRCYNQNLRDRYANEPERRGRMRQNNKRSHVKNFESVSRARKAWRERNPVYSFLSRYNTVISGVKRRGISMSLSFEEYKKLVEKKKCSYGNCELPPKRWRVRQDR